MESVSKNRLKHRYGMRQTKTKNHKNCSVLVNLIVSVFDGPLGHTESPEACHCEGIQVSVSGGGVVFRVRETRVDHCVL